MKIELKSIEVLARNSHETVCYTAVVWVDGRRAGHVGNHGTGGADIQQIEAGLLAGINAWLANNEPPLAMGAGIDMPIDLELWCAEQVGAFALQRDLTRQMKRKMLFSKEGKIFELKKGKHDVESLVEHIRAKHGHDAIILNTLDRDEAIALYKSAAA